MKENTKPLWLFPWGYPESVSIGIGIFLVSLGLDVTIGNAPTIHFPFNIIAGGILLVVIGLLFFFQSKNRFSAWFGSVPAAVSSIGLFVMVSVVMALIPQKLFSDNPFENILGSWMYFTSYIFILLTLGIASLKRLIPFEKKNISYLINHWGLFIALFCAGLGAGDVQKWQMDLQEGTPVWYAEDEHQQQRDVPFALELVKFNMEEYLPKVAIINTDTRDIITHNGVRQIVDMDTVNAFTLGGETIEIEKFHSSAQVFMGDFKPVYDFGSAPAASIKRHGVDSAEWISCGNFFTPSAEVPLSENLSIVMAQPEPKRFYSNVRVFLPTDTSYLAQIEVNKPLDLEGWKIYQTSYDQSKGKWSKTSGLELVRDPWLPYVYVGLFMLIIGSFFLIFQLKTKE